MNQAMQGKPLTIFGDGGQTRAFSYVGDVAPHIAASVDVQAAYNEVFNVGADQAVSVGDLATMVGEVMGVEPEIRHLPARNEVVHAFADHSKVQSVFGLHGEVPLRDGLSRMAAWAKRVGARKSAAFEGVELTRGLPAVWLEEDLA